MLSPVQVQRAAAALGIIALLAAWLLDVPGAAAGSFSVGSGFATITVDRPSLRGTPRSSGGGGGGGGGGWGRGGGGVDREAARLERERQREAEFRNRLAKANESSNVLQLARAKGILEAFNRDALGQLRREADNPQVPGGRSICFDQGRCVPVRGGAVDVRDIVAVHQRDSVISDAVRRKHPEIAAWEKDREAARAEIGSLQGELDQLQANPSANAMEIYKRKEKRSQMESKIAWDTYQIEQYKLID